MAAVGCVLGVRFASLRHIRNHLSRSSIYPEVVTGADCFPPRPCTKENIELVSNYADETRAGSADRGVRTPPAYIWLLRRASRVGGLDHGVRRRFLTLL